MKMKFSLLMSCAKTEGLHTVIVSEASGSERVMKLSGASRTYSHTAEPRFVKKADKTSELPEVSSADAGKLLGVDEEGDIGLVEGGEGKLPDITPNDAKKMLGVNINGKLILSPWLYYLDFTSTDGGTTWTCDKTFNEISELIGMSYIPTLFSLRFNAIIDENEVEIGVIASVIGTVVSRSVIGDQKIFFSVSSDNYVIIDSNDSVEVVFDQS